MKIVAISDTHNQHHDIAIPDGDVVIHAGDLTRQGTYPELEDFLCWFAALPHKHKIFISGNHDKALQALMGVEDKLIPAMEKTGKFKNSKGDMLSADNIHYLRDTSIEIDGIIFHGSPWSPAWPPQSDWAFQRERGRPMASEWEKLPSKIDVLITHGPPYGHGDLAPPYYSTYARNAGCLELLKRVIEIEPRYHIFGHIHGGYGRSESDECKTVFINASCCTEKYRATNTPQIIEIYD